LEKNKLPDSWESVSLSEISQINPHKPEKNSISDNLEVSFLPMKNVEEVTGKIDLSETRKYSKVRTGYTYFQNEDIIFAKITPCMENGKMAIVTGLKNRIGFGSTEFHVIRLKNKLSRKFYFLYFVQEDFRNNAQHKMKGTAGQKRVSSEYMKKCLVPVPPVEEQKRIVEKLEELFSDLDNSKHILENIKLQLKQYHESFLKSLFEGKLTEKWREKNKPNLNLILKKIELGRKNQDKKLQNIENNKIEDFFSIPQEWMWIKVGIISKEIQYGTSEKATTNKSKIPVLRMGNIQNGELDFKHLKYYPDDWKNYKQFSLSDGDVLFNRTNSAELVGKTAIYREQYPNAVFAGYLIRIKIIDETYTPSLLSHYINSIFGKSYINSVVTQQVGQANVNSTKLLMMPLPLMSFEEQKELIIKLEFGFSLTNNTKNIVNSLLSQLDTLRSTMLKQAFEGKLVPQDPNDEPASELLKRIKSK